MPFPTTEVFTELKAVNQILSSVGQAPVTTLDLVNPEVSIPLDTLRDVSRKVQTEGWSFNTERKHPMNPDPTTHLVDIPNNMLSVDGNTYHLGKYDLVPKNGFLYDRLNHTDKFYDEVKVDVVWFFDFQYLPAAVQEYIIARAARLAAVKMVGDSELNQLLTESEMMARATLMEYECLQGDYTMFGHRDGEGEYYTSYQPYRALFRQ